jgi:iron complex outermembrane receptor protein
MSIDNDKRGAISLALLLLGTASVHAQDGAKDLIQEVVVIGSTLKSSDAVHAAVPVNVITAEEIAKSGAVTIADYLTKIPALTGAGMERDGAGVGATLAPNIHGIGSKYTLMLVNGRRLSANVISDLRYVPVAAIERVELLKAGASGLYGSDAVSGVVNFVLKTSYDGAAVSALYGESYRGDASNQDASLTFGGKSESGGFVFVANYFSRGAILGADRLLVHSNDTRELGGLDFRSSTNSPATINGVPGRGAIILDTDRFPKGTYSLNPADYRPYVFERDAYDRIPDGVTYSNPLDRVSVYFGGDSDLGHGVQVFSDMLFSQVKEQMYTGMSVLNLSNSQIGGVPATNPYNPFGIALSNVAVRFNEVGPADTRLQRTMKRGVLGLRGKIGDFDASLAGTVFDNEVRNRRDNMISLAGLRAALNRTGPTAFNPFGNEANSAAQYAGVVMPRQFTNTQGYRSVDALLSGPLFKLPAGAVELSVGAEYRKVDAGLRAEATSIAGGFADAAAQTPYQLDRNIRSAFAETRIPLVGPSAGASRNRLELSAALRHEKYSDAGGTTDPMVALKWDALPDQLMLRASYNTSFRAPDLESTTNDKFTQQGFVVDPLTGGALGVQITTGSNPALKPEDSKTYTAGLVFEPLAVPNLRVSTDYFRVEQENQIVAPTAQAVISGLAPGTVCRCAGQGIADVQIEALLVNLASTKIEGIDFETVWGTTLGAYRLDLSLNASRLMKFEADTGFQGGPVSYLGEYSVLSASNGFGGLPKWRGQTSVGLSRGGFTSSIGVNYVGDYLDARSTAPATGPGRIDSFTTLDFAASYAFGELGIGLLDGIVGRVGLENALNSQPDFVRGNNGYDQGLASIRGRFWSVALSAKF